MKLKKRIFLVTIFALVFAISVCCLYTFNNTSQRLSKTQIAKLREQYPVCGIDVPDGLYLKKFSLNEVIEETDSFVYGEVLGDVSTYSVALSTGNKALDDKRKANGISDVFEFYEYTVSVIDDTEGKYTKGEQITISSNAEFLNYNPSFSDGMKIVVPVIRNKDKPTRHSYTVDGTFYVTEDGYAISAFEEDSRSRVALSGIKADALLKELKK